MLNLAFESEYSRSVPSTFPVVLLTSFCPCLISCCRTVFFLSSFLSWCFTSTETIIMDYQGRWKNGVGNENPGPRPCSHRSWALSSAVFFFQCVLRPQKPYGLSGTGEEWHWEWESRPISVFTQLLSSEQNSSSFFSLFFFLFFFPLLLYVHRSHQAYCGRGALDGHLDFHTASELCRTVCRSLRYISAVWELLFLKQIQSHRGLKRTLV